MSVFLIAASVLLVAMVVPGIVCVRARAIDGVVALELCGTLATLTLLCLAEGFHRSFEYGVAVLAAVLSWLSGMTFVRFVGRWL